MKRKMFFEKYGLENNSTSRKLYDDYGELIFEGHFENDIYEEY